MFAQIFQAGCRRNFHHYDIIVWTVVETSSERILGVYILAILTADDHGGKDSLVLAYYEVLLPGSTEDC